MGIHGNSGGRKATVQVVLQLCEVKVVQSFRGKKTQMAPCFLFFPSQPSFDSSANLQFYLFIQVFLFIFTSTPLLQNTTFFSLNGSSLQLCSSSTLVPQLSIPHRAAGVIFLKSKSDHITFLLTTSHLELNPKVFPLSIKWNFCLPL